MAKRLLILNGWAILAVVINHGAAFGQIAMFLWTDRYRPVAVPNWDQLGTLPYYILMMLRAPGVIAVPSFVFVAGFFIAYALRGRTIRQSWKIVGMRIVHLLVPYIVWSAIFFATDAIDGKVLPWHRYLTTLFTEGAYNGFYFIPLLCYLYLLSPLLVSIAKPRPWLVFVLAAFIQLIRASLGTLTIFAARIPVLEIARHLTPGWTPVPFVFFFVLGIVANLQSGMLRGWISCRRRTLLVAMAVLFVFYLIESDMILQKTQRNWGATADNVSYHLCATAFILWFIGFGTAHDRFSRAIDVLAERSYGIYLGHFLIMGYVARILRVLTPQLLAYQVLFAIIISSVGLGGILFFMEVIRKSPLRTGYRYLFG